MISAFESKILDNLVKRQLLKKEQVKEIETICKGKDKSFEDTLAKRFQVPPKDILVSKSEVAGVAAYTLNGSEIPKKVLDYIPVETVRQYSMIPVMEQEGKLIVGMVDPTNIKAKDALRFIFFRNNVETEIVAITEGDFKSVSAKYEEFDKEVSIALEEIEESTEELEKDSEEKWQVTGSESKENKMLRSAPIVKVVAVILRHAIEGNASDIHIEASRENTRVRFRLDGDLHTNLVLPLSVHNAIVARIKILSSLKLDESRVPQDGRFSTNLKGESIDFRVSTFPTSTGEKVVLRVLNSSASILDFDKLGMLEYQYTKLKELLHLPYGMILVSGPTGSGKSTTLYAALNNVNKEDVNIVSLEDPVEYYMQGINQSQIRADIGYTFATGLRHILRQDPDIVLVGEIRDKETAELSVQASLTGHLLFSSIHTNNTVGVIPRLIDMGIDAFLLPSSLSAMLAQRLVGRLCEACKTKMQATSSMEQMIVKEIQPLSDEVKQEYNLNPPYYIYESSGCVDCKQTKVKGRMGIYELLTVTDEMKKVILDDPNDIAIGEVAQSQGMITMRQDGIIKALQGNTSVEEVFQKTED